MTATSTFVPVAPLTRESIKAMRNADSAVLRWEQLTAPEDASGYARRTNEGHITVNKEVDRGDGFGRETLHVDIPSRVIVNNYGGSGIDGDESRLAPAIKGSWVLLSLSVAPEWQTIVSLLRSGDTLVQEWVVDNRNTLLTRAHLTVHEIKLRVERPVARGRIRVMTFMLDAGVREPGSHTGEITRGRTA